MATIHDELSDKHIAFIERQKMFFVATAAPTGRINVSPKGHDALRVLDPSRVVWLNLTGSGNESAAHIKVSDRMTIMFCSFEGKPLILRIYGRARAVHLDSDDFDELNANFSDFPGVRQIFDVTVDSVLVSCGDAVPLYEFRGQRSNLIEWIDNKGEHGIRDYWRKQNGESLDGLPTGIEGNFD